MLLAEFESLSADIDSRQKPKASKCIVKKFKKVYIKMSGKSNRSQGSDQIEL